MSIDLDWFDRSDPVGYRFDVDRRGFLRLLGCGVAVAVARVDCVEGATQPAGAVLARDISAWIHVADDGSITVFTGKTEVGQNIRTSLSQAVSEELRVSMSVVTVLMADTAKVPFDGGTTGSRTTPVMSLQLRKAASAARRALVRIAAERWQLPETQLEARDGRIVHPATGRTISFGELASTNALMTVVADDEKLVPAAEWRTLGKPAPKVNGVDFVTGRHKYAFDMSTDGMLFGRVKRPPSFGAVLRELDSADAAALSGVRVVRDGNFVGVVAPSSREAARALDAVKATWTTTPGPNDRTVFEYFRHTRGEPDAPGRTMLPPRIIGSTRDAFARSDRHLQATYTAAFIAHAPLEPRAAIAEWDRGRLTVWTATQRPFPVRDELAAAFAMPADQVRVVVPDTGSAYGGKHTGEAAIEAARLARAVGRPVKVAWTRQEEFSDAYFRPAGVIAIRSAARDDGRILAFEFDSYNAGPAALYTNYDFANQRIEMHPTACPLRVGSYRGLAATANHFARETHLDELAHELGLDPLAVRLKNLTDDRQRAVIAAVVARASWMTRRRDGRFLGLASGNEKGSFVASIAEVVMDPGKKLRVSRVTTAFECGAIVNPDGLLNQVNGALLQGIGGALFERIQFDGGRIINARFSQYRVPRFADVPVLDTILLDRKDLPSAGAGETPIVAVAPAIGNAMFAATGVRLRGLPLLAD